jgi:hypothetical protein
VDFFQDHENFWWNLGCFEVSKNKKHCQQRPPRRNGRKRLVAYPIWHYVDRLGDHQGPVHVDLGPDSCFGRDELAKASLNLSLATTK